METHNVPKVSLLVASVEIFNGHTKTTKTYARARMSQCAPPKTGTRQKEGKVIWISFDIEIGGPSCGIIQLSAVFLILNTKSLEISTPTVSLQEQWSSSLKPVSTMTFTAVIMRN